jgi:hypothetical protein
MSQCTGNRYKTIRIIFHINYNNLQFPKSATSNHSQNLDDFLNTPHMCFEASAQPPSATITPVVDQWR